MKVNELRIGNWYQSDGSVYQLTIESLKRQIDWEIEGFGNATGPIQLTEEWLVKFGFEKCGEYYTHKETSFELVHTHDKKHFVVSINCYEYTHGEKFEFVHELQNIFYWTERKELKIKTDGI